MDLFAELKEWLWPTYVPQEYNYFIAAPKAKPAQRKPSAPVELHTEFAGYNNAGNVLKSTPLSFQDDKTTAFSTVKAFAKGKATEANVVAHLTELDKEEIARRKPLLSDKAAIAIKAVFADRAGATTAKELALITGYSPAYCECAIASFRAALLRERGQSGE